MELETRLVDYINLKKFYKQNKITISYSPEKQFNITREDLAKINNYFHLKPTIQYNQIAHYNDSKFLSENHKENQTQTRNLINKHQEKPAYMIGEILENKDKFTNPFKINSINNEIINKMPYNIFDNSYNLRGTPSYTNNIGNIPTHTKKSYGYDNNYENSYYYIDNNMQLPEHIDMNFPRGGESSRLDKKVNRKYDIQYLI